MGSHSLRTAEHTVMSTLVTGSLLGLAFLPRMLALATLHALLRHHFVLPCTPAAVTLVAGVATLLERGMV